MHAGNTIKNLKKFSRYLIATPQCNLCESGDREIWTQVDNIMAYRCNSCGLVYLDPQLNKEGREKFYSSSGYFEIQNDPEDARLRDSMYEIDLNLLRKHITSGRVLDIGCGGGFYLDKFGGQWERQGLEIDKKAVAYANEHFDFEVQRGEIEDADYPVEYFDVISMRGLIEHLSEPKKEVCKTVSWLKPGGYVYITATPNVESLCAELYRDKWRLFTADHQFHFSKHTLTRLMEELGLSLHDSEYFYLETPYANEIEDYRKILRDAELMATGKEEEVKASPPFYGNMLSMIFRKDE